MLPDYDALIELGEDRIAERDALLATLSLAKSEVADLGQANSWLTEADHPEYAQQIGLDAILGTRELLARGYQLRWYDETNGKMLAIYAGKSAWPDVSEEKTGSITAEQMKEPAKDPNEEELAAVSLSPLYVYYGEHEGRSREGEGIWYILKPGSRDYETLSYQWVDDAPIEGFVKKPAPQSIAKSTAPGVDYVRITNIEFDRNAYLNKALTEYVVTVEYNCPPNETFELRVGHYYKPRSYAWGSTSMTTISGSSVFQCCIGSIWMDWNPSWRERTLDLQRCWSILKTLAYRMMEQEDLNQRIRMTFILTLSEILLGAKPDHNAGNI